MSTGFNALAFPSECPSEYVPLDSEPPFIAAKHLLLEFPDAIFSLHDLGYCDQDIATCESSFGYCNAFRILSDEGVALMENTCKRIYHNRNSCAGTGANRLGSYARGAGYRSKFIRDFCDSPELAAHLSAIANITLGRHSVPAVACGINYAPDDITKAVDNWHVDSVSYDIVMMLSDPNQIRGGEFQIFSGTKQEGREILGISGEEGMDTQLPEDRVITLPFPAAGYGFLQQGNMIFHRACRLQEKADRITMVPSFEVLPRSAMDATNSINMSSWADPGIQQELTRHEIWRASARLDKLLDEVSLNDNPTKLAANIEKAIGKLLAFKNNLEEHH
ncbi:MAG TPA: hypothetical protein EYQ44_04345 [Porticoccaceae bacterium]|nr:hypothetical protein [Porticoccaceae bacterium]HIK80840.1 hypothetical protein [Porticoccaceae bacterium]